MSYKHHWSDTADILLFVALHVTFTPGFVEAARVVYVS